MKNAIPNEQKALQSLLRAEATFRQIQVAFGARGGGGGGGGGAARDLAGQRSSISNSIPRKNQYETRETAASTEEQKAKAIDDALKKLDELAKREENLAQQQRNGAQTAEQKWQQEMLQREAQQLQQQMEQQLNQQSRQGQGQQGQQGKQGQAGQQGQGQQGQAGQGQGQQGSQGGSASGQSASGQPNSGQDTPGQPNSGQPSAQAAEQAAQRALDRLRQANEDMKRASSQNASAADSRRAADRLREATDLLGATQQQDASGRLNSMAQTAEQLAAEQKKQADHVRDLIAQINAAKAAGKAPPAVTGKDVDKMVDDRQKVADDLSHLTQQMRGAARELAPTQPGASNKFRSALNGLDENDLGTRMQRSSDYLRNGNFSDPAETALTSDLHTLGQQLTDAARALGGSTQRTSKDAEINRAMDDLSRLRDQLAGLGGNPNGPRNPQAGQGQPGQQQFQSGQLSRNGQPSGQAGQQQGQAGQQQGQPGQQPSGQPGQQSGQQQAQSGQGGGQAGQGGNRAGGQGGNRAGGQVGNRGGGGTAMGALSVLEGTGGGSGRAGDPRTGTNPADTQRDIDQGLNLLNQVRAAVQDSPEARQELQALIDQMRNLDPKRFQGNRAQMEQMHQQLVSEVDALELQLRRQLDETRGGTIRNTDPTKVPAGYQDSVAEYYRKLSGGGAH